MLWHCHPWHHDKHDYIKGAVGPNRTANIAQLERNVAHLALPTLLHSVVWMIWNV